MTSNYVKYSKPQYEYNLNSWKRQRIIGDFLDTQPDLVRNGYSVNEVVYVVKTHRKVKKHLSIKTLFTNLEDTFKSTLAEVRSPSFNFSNFRLGIGLEQS